ncbi:MAG: 50S ribosomal protein L23 [Spirochaetia bacterium]|jgi:large subunit ribosomal protein L23
MDADKVIIEPVLTEKANALRETNQYVFRVDARANKIQIKSAIRELFGVHPVACNVLNVSRKPKRVRYKQGFTASWKKAVVTLSPGETISIFEGA